MFEIDLTPETYELAIFELDRGYGGSEEGGWWYDMGERKRVLKRTFTDEESAYAACRRVNRWLDLMRPEWVRDIGSVVYSGGFLSCRVYPAGQSPEFFPSRRPHYE